MAVPAWPQRPPPPRGPSSTQPGSRNPGYGLAGPGLSRPLRRSGPPPQAVPCGLMLWHAALAGEAGRRAGRPGTAAPSQACPTGSGSVWLHCCTLRRQGAGGARTPSSAPPLPPLTCHCTELEVTQFQDSDIAARLDQACRPAV